MLVSIKFKFPMGILSKIIGARKKGTQQLSVGYEQIQAIFTLTPH